jgi:hypothetical protein
MIITIDVMSRLAQSVYYLDTGWPAELLSPAEARGFFL